MKEDQLKNILRTELSMIVANYLFLYKTIKIEYADFYAELRKDDSIRMIYFEYVFKDNITTFSYSKLEQNITKFLFRIKGDEFDLTRKFNFLNSSEKNKRVISNIIKIAYKKYFDPITDYKYY